MGLSTALALVQSGIGVRIIDKQPIQNVGQRGAGLTVRPILFCLAFHISEQRMFSATHTRRLSLPWCITRHQEHWCTDGPYAGTIVRFGHSETTRWILDDDCVGVQPSGKAGQAVVDDSPV